jgi:hypothetical protein
MVTSVATKGTMPSRVTAKAWKTPKARPTARQPAIPESLAVNFLMRRKGPYTAQLEASNEVLKGNKL